MHSGKRSKSKTRTVTSKVTPEEESLLKERASQEGLTLSEWSRKSLLACAQFSPDTRLLLSELMALRVAFLAIQSDALAAGQGLSRDRVAQIVNAAETGKLAAADKRLEAYRSQASTLPDSGQNGTAA